MAVFPESMERLDPEDTTGSLKILDEYIRYMGERIEFGMRNMTKSVNAAGISSTELYILLVAMDNRTSALESTVNGLRGTVTSLQNSVTSLQSNVTSLQSSVTSLQSSVSTLEGSLEGLDERVTRLEGTGE